MQKRKVPMRKCVVTNEMKPKKEMIRIVRNKEGVVAIDPTGKMPGRGAYVSIEPTIVQTAWDKHVLDRHLEATINDEFYQELLDYVTHQKARMSL
ncbi:YlxR family protein [Carnobacterium maltaromaticum]|uniref:YlxR family protein n=1 Tax=Carnobacterium maltaromaticum TaxID=2751 RepID=A0AAW9JRI5_CARML|nr:YlxR family protein [Carnobacterium maltaromaticum]MDZ5758133.1 YlxR family protein [Carnobacterium maltaromaticum]